MTEQATKKQDTETRSKVAKDGLLKVLIRYSTILAIGAFVGFIAFYTLRKMGY